MSQPMDGFHGFSHQALSLGNLFFEDGRIGLGRFFQSQKPEVDRYQGLGDVIMKLAAGSSPLLFL